jgi:hypothetical protein
MNKTQKWIAIIATIVSIIAGLIAISEYFTRQDDIFLEQRIDPDVLESYREKGLDVTIEKGITIKPLAPEGNPPDAR